MASTVTYKGPNEKARAKSVAYQIDNGDKDITFRIGVPVDDVPEAVVKRLKADKEHDFDVHTQTQGGGS